MEAEVSSPHSPCARHVSITRARLSQSKPSTFYLRLILILSSRLFLGLSSDLFLSYYSTWPLYAIIFKIRNFVSLSAHPLYMFHPAVLPITSHTVFRACRLHLTSLFFFTAVQQSSAEPISVKSIVVFSDDSRCVQGYKKLLSEKYEQRAVVFCFGVLL